MVYLHPDTEPSLVGTVAHCCRMNDRQTTVVLVYFFAFASICDAVFASVAASSERGTVAVRPQVWPSSPTSPVIL
ncbi:hypothetical protein [Streptomyces prunicolor]|uniref:hypothetical protein n=1 Tax=Streptomyces prunicolor TaxID=67348 RepID=UPI0033EA331B